MAPTSSPFRFDHMCKYFQEVDNKDEALPMFRFKEILDDCSVFTADTFGDGSWIDISVPRLCSPECACRQFNLSREEETFAFTVTKSQNALQVQMHSLKLAEEVLEIVVPEKAKKEEYSMDEDGAFDGFALLRHRSHLTKKLKQLRLISSHQGTIEAHKLRLISELSLLVDGMLGDSEITQPFHRRAPLQGLQLQQSFDAQAFTPDRDTFLNTATELPCSVSLSYGNPELNFASQSGYTPPESFFPYAAYDDFEGFEGFERFEGFEGFDASYGREKIIAQTCPILDSNTDTLDSYTDFGSGALSVASSRGDEEAVLQLLRGGADPNTTEVASYLGPALYEAALAGHESIVRILLNHGASVNGTWAEDGDSSTYRPLLAAIERRSHIITQLLLNRLTDNHLHEVNLFDGCPLKDRWIVAKNLLNFGLGAETLSKHATELSNPDERLVSILVGAGSDVASLERRLSLQGHDKILSNAMNHFSCSQRLINAVERGSKTECEQEIAAGADPSWALATSLRLQRPDLARYLLTRGADPRLLDIGGDLACDIGKDNLSAMLTQAARWNDKQLLAVLLDQGGDVNSIDPKSGETILVEAIRAESYVCVEYLLICGALVNGLGLHETSPLTVAVQTRQSSIVSLLLSHGAPHEKDSDGLAISSDCPTDQLSAPWVDLMISGSPSYLKSLSKKAAIPTSSHLHGKGEENEEESFVASEAVIDKLGRRSSDPNSSSEHGSPEQALFHATREGNVTAVQNILQCAFHGDNSNSTLRNTLSLDDFHDGSTCLMEAVRKGHLRIARALLQFGADVNVMSPTETALSIAAKGGIESVLRLLFQYGADFHVAVLMLQLDHGNTAAVGAIKRLNITTKRCQDVILKDVSNKRGTNLLYEKFLQEHKQMRRVATASGLQSSRHATVSNVEALDRAVKPDFSKRWACNLELDSHKAWLIGRETLKGLCRRKMPEDLNQTLLFLALAKSMSSVLHDGGRGDPRRNFKKDNEKEFKEDIERWQILFEAENGGQRDFGEAVNAIWAVNLGEYKPRFLNPGQEDLDHFQTIALRVTKQAACFYRGNRPDDAGLISTRAKWKLRHCVDLLQPSDVTQTNLSQGDERWDNGDAFSRTCTSIKDDIPDGPHADLALEEMPDYYHLRRTDMLLAILMAGTIFSIVIEFLLAAGHSFFMAAGEDDPGDILLPIRKESLKIIAASILIKAAPDKEFSDQSCGGAVLEAVREQTNEAIESGQINSHTSLANFFIRDIEHKYVGLGKALAASCDRRRCFNVMQNAYSTLQAFLGLPITPVRPESLKQVPAKSMNADAGRKKRAAHDPIEGERCNSVARTSPHVFNLSHNLTPSSDGSSSSALSGESASMSAHGKVTFCVDCDRDYKTTSNYGKHRKGPRHDNKRYPCAYSCGKDFLRNDTRLKHEKKAHQGIMATKPRLPGSVSE